MFQSSVNTQKHIGIFALLVLFSLTIMIPEVAGKDNSLVAYYPMDGNFKDASGNGYDLTPISPDQSFSEDKYIKKGKNLCFGPTKDLKIKYGATSGKIPSDIKKGYTISGFIAKPGGNDYALLLWGFGTSKYKDPKMLVELPYGVLAAGTGDTVIQRWKRFNEGGWHHVALRIHPENSPEKDKYDVFIDGKKVLSGPVKRLNSYGKFSIGIITGNQIAGLKIDEVKLFSKALTDKEIAEEAVLKGVPQPKAQHGASGASSKIDCSERRKKPDKTIKPVGKLKIFFLTDNCLCVAGDYNHFICDRIKKECGSFLLKLDNGEIKVPDWSYKFHYNFAFNEVVTDYRPKIKNNFENPDYFIITDESRGKKIRIGSSGYWINAIGQMRVPRIKDGKKLLVSGAAVAHFAYIKLSEPLKNGNKYLISTKNGERIAFQYNDRKIISRAIKVNQVGYAPDAGEKYAYIGSWLADLGPLDLSKWNGGKFYIIDKNSGADVFTGTIKKRADEQYHKGIPLNGEIVYEMNFSGFAKKGAYHIYIPGMGCSWDFSISDNALGEAFFIHARGLYHQRCGIAKKKPYTNWVMGKCHKETWKGGFPPNDQHYRKENKAGFHFTDENGKPVKVNPFSVVSETATNEKLPEVWGGWHDAADYDRRTYHFVTVRDLLSAYLMFPAKFPDGQLNIPESGNNVPDIIDEAAWGVDVWRRAQNEKGGVGCWIEATSHPKNQNPSTDTQKYYLAIPTRESTIDYAGCAAMLAMAYKKCGAEKKSTLFLKSAEKAFQFAITSDNSSQTKFTVTDRKKNIKKIRYKEPPELDKSAIFKAALDLYLLTGKEMYREYLTEDNFNSTLATINYPRNSFFLSELLINKDKFPEFTEKFRQFIIQKADERLKWQEALAYRNLNWPAGHGYFRFMGWGACMPFRKGRYFISAYRITGDKKYRDAALLLNDWMCGANPMGRTMTTGLGKVAPVNLLSLASYSDGIAEPVPGITVYTFTGRTNYNAPKYSFGLNVNPRKDHGWNGSDICLLPKSLTKGRSPECGEIRGIIDKMYPLWRRFCNIEGLNVPQNEFTIWETIGPAAACLGCLLPDGWMPGNDLKNRKPAKTKEELEGYIFQP